MRFSEAIAGIVIRSETVRRQVRARMLETLIEELVKARVGDQRARFADLDPETKAEVQQWAAEVLIAPTAFARVNALASQPVAPKRILMAATMARAGVDVSECKGEGVE